MNMAHVPTLSELSLTSVSDICHEAPRNGLSTAF